jgi:DNA-binding transcriptional MerR regulator
MKSVPVPAYYGLSAAARSLGISESALRSYSEAGIVKPLRDSAGRRLFSESDLVAAREHLAKHSKDASRG